MMKKMTKLETYKSVLPYEFRFMKSDELEELKKKFIVSNTCLMQPKEETKEEETKEEETKEEESKE